MKRSRRAAILAVRALPWAVLLGLVGLNMLYISRLGPNDDAYITYRVARNLASGVGPVYNPGERVLSITTPGYMLLLAASSVFSRNFVALGLALNALGLFAVGALLIDLSRPSPLPLRSDGFSRPSQHTLAILTASLAATVAVTLTLTFPLLTESIGMETPLYLAAVLAAFAAYRRAWEAGAAPPTTGAQRDEKRWLLWTAAAAAAALLLRPDGALVAVAVGAHWLVTRRRLPWAALALGLALTLPWLLFAWIYYGSPVPNTLAAKMTQAVGTELPGWGAALAATARTWATGHLLAALLAGMGLIRAARRPADRLPLLLWAALYVSGHLLLDVRSYFWYYAPLAPVVALLAGDGVAWLVVALSGWLARWLFIPYMQRAALTLATLILVVLAVYPAVTAAATLATPPLQRRREQVYQEAGLALRELCRPGDLTVGIAEVGILGYLSDCRVVDFAGLLQRDVAHLRQGPAAKTEWALKRYAPPLVLLAGGVGYPHTVAEQPWFRQRYAPVQVHEQDGYRAAIYGRVLGPSQQHDLAAGWWRVDAGQPVTTTLVFPANVEPALAVHAYLPAGSALEVMAADQLLAELDGDQARWTLSALPVPDAATLAERGGAVTLTLQGSAGEQPAAAAWLESNALPIVHYFVPLEDASIRPYPSVRLEQGQALTATLAAVAAPPRAIEVMYRDRPGVALEVWAGGKLLGVTGGRDGWRADRLAMPSNLGPQLDVQLRNRAPQFSRVVYVAVVPTTAGPTRFDLPSVQEATP